MSAEPFLQELISENYVGYLANRPGAVKFGSHGLSRCIEDDYMQKYKSVRRTVDSRLRKMIRRKKQSLGIKDDQSHNYEQSY